MKNKLWAIPIDKTNIVDSAGNILKENMMKKPIEIFVKIALIAYIVPFY